MESALQIAREASHLHIAFPCGSFTRARRSDEHGQVRVVRSDAHPEGWGHPVAERGNQILERIFALCLTVLEHGGTFSLENPADSFAWETRWMKKLLKRTGVRQAVLDQCCFGAQTMKPTRIVINAEWMLQVSLRCSTVRPHFHLNGGLQGKTWDPISKCMIWKTARAAEYPSGLCLAWTRSLSQWTQTAAALEQVGSNLVRCGRHGNVLVRGRRSRGEFSLAQTSAVCERPLSKATLREQENAECCWGLRDPRRSVAGKRCLAKNRPGHA